MLLGSSAGDCEMISGESCLLAVAWKPQPSKKYSGHSLLKGGASGVFHGTFALHMYNVLTILTTFSVDSANMPPLRRPCRGICHHFLGTHLHLGDLLQNPHPSLSNAQMLTRRCKTR